MSSDSLREQNIRLKAWQWEKAPEWVRAKYPTMLDFLRDRQEQAYDPAKDYCWVCGISKLTHTNELGHSFQSIPAPIPWML